MKKGLSKSIRNEKGQALAIVLALLAIGALTIVPLLRYTYTGLSASRIYDEKMELSYAAEAGLEDGIWKTDNETIPLNPYDYGTVYNYSLPENINNAAVDVSIKQVWPLAGLESDAYGTEPVDNLAVTGGVVDVLGGFQVRLTYYDPDEPLYIDRVAVWLPPGFEYDADSSSGITAHDDVPDNPTEVSWNGGTALEWDFFAPVDFAYLPEPGAGGGIGGMEPGVEMSLRVLEFSVTPQGEVAKGSYSWVKTTDIPNPYLSWERNITIYRIDSTATDNTTGKTATAKGYTYVSEGIETDWINTGGLFTGNYRAVGNTLMLDKDGDYVRETLITDSAGSSATIANIPVDGEVAFAYLYWSGWYDDTSTDADTTCTFKINQAEAITPSASGYYTECDPYPPSSPNYECVDEATPDGDETYVQTGYAPEILRPNAAGTHSDCGRSGDSPNYRCVDEEEADGDSTYVYAYTFFGTNEEIDTYNMQNHSVGTGIINSVTVYVRSRSYPSAGINAAQTVIRTYGTDHFGIKTSLPASYTELSTNWATNPYTDSAWTWDEIDALEAGVKQYALGYLSARTTQVYVAVSYSGTALTTTLRPNAAGDETDITYQEPSSGAHWDKVNEEAADDFSTYVYTSGTPTPPSSWYDEDWQYRKKITIDYNKVEADLTGFPVLISITDSDLIGHAKVDGSDIVFTSSNGITKLKREIESYDNSSGTLVAWVKADLSSTSDTEIYLYYGNSAASETNDTDTWDTSFKMVLHLHETSGTHQDSTLNDKDGLPQGGIDQDVNGKINGGDQGDGTDDYIQVADSGQILSPSSLTFECWINIQPDRAQYDRILDKKVAWDGNSGWSIEIGSDEGSITFLGSGSTTGGMTGCWTEGALSHVVMTASGTTVAAFLNGGHVDTATINAITSNNIDLRILTGDTVPGTNYIPAIIDEIRISNIARSATWIKTSYNNQSAPSNFYSVGAEELTIGTGAYERDLYNVSDYSDEADINGVTVYFRFSGDYVGVDDYTGYARAAIKTNGTVYLGSVESQMGKTFVTKSYIWTTNPYTGSPWTWDEIAALQVGIELAGTTTAQAYCTQVYVEVDYSPVETEIDTYNLGDHSQGSGTINSVTVYVRSKSTLFLDTHAAEVVIRTYDNDYSDTYTLLPTSYTDISATWTTNPYTGLAWNWAEIDALEAGVKHYVQSAGGGVRTTQVYVYVDYGPPYEKEITAETWWTVRNLMGHSYSCFRDVTDEVKYACPGGNAIYTVAKVDGHKDSLLSYAGWSLIIIYASPSAEGHQFYLWNVLLYAGKNKSGTFYIEGFHAPEDGDAEATITCFVCEGDKERITETLVFNETSLYDEDDDYDDPIPKGNIWNSISSGLEGEKIDGVDIDTFDVSSLVNPGATSAEVTFTTVNDHWNLIYLILAFRSDVAVLIPSGTGIYSYGF